MSNRLLSVSVFLRLCRLFCLCVMLVLTAYIARAAAASLSVSITTSPLSPQPINTAITLTASATGGTDVEYQFWVYNPNASPAWQQLQAYAGDASCTWTPASAGNYLLSITALDIPTGDEANTLLWYGISGAPLSAVMLSPCRSHRSPPIRPSP